MQEAFISNVLVITSNIGGMREVWRAKKLLLKAG
jgi:hypothetical protein